MPTIEVTLEPTSTGWSSTVTVRDRGSSTTHKVSLSRETHQRLAGGKAPPEVLVEKSFQFLLEREPKESILRSFDLTVISRYFPEFEKEMARRL